MLELYLKYHLCFETESHLVFWAVYSIIEK